MKEEYKDIVRSLYLEVLHKDPDIVGLENYALLMEEEGLTDEAIREALVNSEEFQTTHASEIKIIKVLYQEILDREPEPQGLAHYVWHMKLNNLSKEDIRAILLKSDEYTMRK